METIKFIAYGQSLAACGVNRIVDKQVNFIKAIFILNGWEEVPVRVAQWTQGQTTYNTLLDDEDSCTVPAELATGMVTVSVFGQNADGEMIRSTTNSVQQKISKSGFIDDGETPIPPTPDLYAQLVQTFNNLKQDIIAKGDEIVEAKDIAVEAAQNAEKSAEDALDAVSNAEQAVQQVIAEGQIALTQIDSEKDNAVTAINNTLDSRLSEIGSAADIAVSNVNSAKTSALQSVESKLTSSLQSVNTAKQDAEQGISDLYGVLGSNLVETGEEYLTSRATKIETIAFVKGV